MAAAYAALMSLMHTSKLILHPSQQWLRIHRKRIEFLLQKVHFLQKFLEDYSHRGHEEMAELERHIADMAYAAEDIIESHVLDQILARSTGSEGKSSTSFAEYMQKLVEEMEELIRTKVTRIKETIGKFEEERTLIDFLPAVSSRLAPNEQNPVVGSDEKLIKIMESLTGQQSNRQIIAIVGMAGIGKTTLAKNVYEHPHIKHYFDIRAWATVSQKYSARKIIFEMLTEIEKSKPESVLSDDHLGQHLHKIKQKSILSDEHLGEQLYKSEQKSVLSDQQLGEQLYKSLWGRRYLIVMDDFWSIEAWDEIKPFFPDNGNGSGIMMTTRLGNVAAHLSSCQPFEMEFLDADRSWELLSEKVFGHRGCPPELKELGKTIANNCRGLPLAIVVIGGLLAKSNKTMELWKHVAENLNSIISSEDNENCLKILSLSYNNLPIYLKPCFLYLAIAQEKSDIRIRPLIKAWVSEGFLKPIRAKSLEEVANEYITDLIDRNLIFVRERGILGQVEHCGIHDLLRDLCLREAEKVDFYSVIDAQNPDVPSGIRHLSFHQAPLKFKRSIPHVHNLSGPESLIRSIISDLHCAPLCTTNVRLLRVLVMSDKTFPNEIMQLINLRFMSFVGKWDWNLILRFISSISLFWNLQTLQLTDGSFEPIFQPAEIWCLPHLRHLQFNRCVLPDPPCCHIDKHDSHILENLQTLSIVVFFRCTEEVCRRLPNLKELLVTYDRLSPGVEWPFFRLHNLVHLHKLESLTFQAYSPISSKSVSFPLSLKELTLSRCCLPWEDMTIVGSLPNLEALQLWDYAFKGLTWCPVEGHFVKLKVLVIEETDLLHWRADESHFRLLEHLVLRNLNLEEFPQDFGELLTLRKIEVFSCSDSTNTWAEQIREEQESFGNEGLQVIVHKTDDD